jgi:hypothetical protein
MKLKRQNLFKLNNIYKKMLDANCNKIENIDSIIEIKEMKLKLKNIPNISLNIIKKINEELKIREANKNLEIINKITTLIKNEINNCFDIETYNNQNEEEEEEEEDEDIEINPKKSIIINIIILMKKYLKKYLNIKIIKK